MDNASPTLLRRSTATRIAINGITSSSSGPVAPVDPDSPQPDRITSADGYRYRLAARLPSLRASHSIDPLRSDRHLAVIHSWRYRSSHGEGIALSDVGQQQER